VPRYAFLLLCLEPGLFASPDARLARAFRNPTEAGWIFVHLEGSPSAIGFQHGYLLRKELEDSKRAIRARFGFGWGSGQGTTGGLACPIRASTADRWLRKGRDANYAHAVSNKANAPMVSLTAPSVDRIWRTQLLSASDLPLKESTAQQCWPRRHG
jgi:hypothetical protein